jgi:hypothetical protein
MVGAMGEVLGALVVVASLVYLAVQIRHNSAVSKSEALRAFATDVARWSQAISEGPNADLWAKAVFGRLSRSDLTQAETLRLAMGYLSLLRIAEAGYRSWQHGVLTREDLDGVSIWSSAIFACPFVSGSWDAWQSELPADFLEYMRQNVPQLRELPPGGSAG